MNIEDFLTIKGISTDTTIGIEGDYKLTDLLEEYAEKLGHSSNQNNKPLVKGAVSNSACSECGKRYSRLFGGMCETCAKAS